MASAFPHRQAPVRFGIVDESLRSEIETQLAASIASIGAIGGFRLFTDWTKFAT